MFKSVYKFLSPYIISVSYLDAHIHHGVFYFEGEQAVKIKKTRPRL